ncbi:hypothetical protein [Moraxella lacunata]
MTIMTMINRLILPTNTPKIGIYCHYLPFATFLSKIMLHFLVKIWFNRQQ